MSAISLDVNNMTDEECEAIVRNSVLMRALSEEDRRMLSKIVFKPQIKELKIEAEMAWTASNFNQYEGNKKQTETLNSIYKNTDEEEREVLQLMADAFCVDNFLQYPFEAQYFTTSGEPDYLLSSVLEWKLGKYLRVRIKYGDEIIYSTYPGDIIEKFDSLDADLDMTMKELE